MLSILIAARNEIHLKRTLEDILENAEGEIEVIVVLDGWIPDPPFAMNDNRIFFSSYEKSVGQRAAINEAARLAKGKFIMKLDAHCALGKGFDVILAADCEYNWTVIPTMYVLDAETWKPKLRKKTEYMYIAKEPLLKAQYYRRWPKSDKKIDDTMCCMGPGWFMHKDRFWELGGMDENHGGWGQMGVEVACKAWLSGGSLKVNKNTWFAHMHRQFPYHITTKDTEKARKYSRDLWLNNKWDKQVRNFDWMLKKFNPPGWVIESFADSDKKDYYEYFTRKPAKIPKWMGVDVIKYPNDLITYQEVMYKNKPDFLIETGTHKGGSALFFANVFDSIGKGHVITIDIKDHRPPAHPRITYIIGRTTEKETLAKVRKMIGNGSVMASLDSNHHRSHVKRELINYGAMITEGQYMVVEDTVSHESKNPPGPREAVEWYLKRTKKFVADSLENKYVFSLCPGGWLRRVTEPVAKTVTKPGVKNSDTTIIYYTDNTLEPKFEKRVQDELLKAADGKRIVSVSKKPLSFGDNICVGDLPRSHLSLFTQILIGLKAAKTKYVAMAEHDCMYTKEHFNWVPPTEDLFYYNVHHWFVQWNNKRAGEYSYFRRKAMSQLICAREVCIRAVEEKVLMLETGFDIVKGKPGACEPGVCDNRDCFIEDKARVREVAKKLGKDIGKNEKFGAKGFRTVDPNIDIRHDNNFSGGRRSRARTYSIPYWGSFHTVMGEIPPGTWYQSVEINGVAMPTRRKRDTSGIRWKTFIEPLLPFKGENRQFLDLGCNAGFYCRKMIDLGFKATGVEKERDYIRHAQYLETCDPKGLKIVEGNIVNYDIPASHLVLLANVHYWLTPDELNTLVEKLRNKSLYVLLIGRHKEDSTHKSKSGINDLKKVFKGWQNGKEVTGDKHYSILFKNPDLVEKDTDEIFHTQQLSKSKKFLPSYSKLVKDVISGKTIDTTHDYYEYLKWRKARRPDEKFEHFLELIKNVRENGIIEPLIIGRTDGDGNKYNENRLTDGDHRYIIARELGIRKIICRTKKGGVE